MTLLHRTAVALGALALALGGGAALGVAACLLAEAVGL